MLGAYSWQRVRPFSFFLIGLSVVAPPALAEGTAERALSLADARDLATRGGADVVLAERREAVARAQVDAAGALGNPTLGVQSGRFSARLTTSVSVPVPLFGQRGAVVATARADADAVALETSAVRLEARWNATRAWLDLWEAQEKAALLETAADEARRLAGIARERFAAGSTPRLDALRTNADRARAEAEALAAKTGVAAASARLALWLGAADRAPLRAVGAPDLSPLPSDEGVLQSLLARHPALERDRARVAAAAARVRSEERLRWPVVNAELAVSQADPTLPGTDVIGGLSFEAPVLSQRGGAIARARAEQGLAEATTDIEARRLGMQLADAYEQAQGADIRARALGKEVLPALEETRRMTEEGYRDGRVDLLRVLETQRALLEGRLAYVEARSTSQRALADVERALGVPLGGAEDRAR
jgi:cobalt-zinc-cadmium efflux system outer membrane protein